MGKGSADRLELIERNRVLLALKLFPWSLLVAQPVIFRRAVGSGDGGGGPKRGRHGAFSRACVASFDGLGASCVAIGAALRMAPRMLRKRRRCERLQAAVAGGSASI